MENPSLNKTHEFEMVLIDKETKKEIRFNVHNLEMSRKFIHFYNHGDLECKEMLGLPWQIHAEIIEADFEEKFLEAQSKYDFYEHS